MIKKIISGIFVVLIFSFLSLSSYAAWLNSVPQTIIQPDGTEIECFATGDEFYNWLHDADGYTIIQDKQTGYYSFAILVGDELISSTYIVGQTNPSNAGLSAWTNIPSEHMKAKRSEFLKNKMPAKPQIQEFKAPGSMKNEGILNNLTVYIRFSDQSEFTQDTTYYWNMFNNDSPGYNSMLNYFYEISYETLSLPSWFYPIPPGSTVISYQDIYERSYFMPYNSQSNPNGYQESQRASREHQLLERAINYIDQEVSEEINLDFNNDGYVDNVVFNVKGAPTAWSTLLWPHRWVLYGENVYINGKQVWDYNFQLETELNSSGTGVLCHEMGHSLSAPDLYHYSAGGTPVGPWDIMGSNANPPQSMSAYLKYRYGGWIDFIPEITECGTYTLNPVSEPDNNCFKIASPNSNTDYYVVEYRKKDGPFESSLPGSGLLIYRVNSTQSGNGNANGPPDELYLYRPGGTINSNGTINTANFAADYNRTEINDNTSPYPFLTNGQPGGLDISNIGFVGETISFNVNFEQAPAAEFESSGILLTQGCSVDFTDLSTCNASSWEWTFEGGQPSSSTDQNPEGIVYQNAGTFNVSLKATNTFGDNTNLKSDYIEVSTSALPETEFYANDTAVCTGGVILFTDYSEVCPDAWNWEITPGTFEFVNGTSSSTQNPEVQFNESATYSISLTVSNANGSTTLDKDDYILTGGSPAPFYEDFESGNSEQNGWTIVNPDNDNTTWEMFSVSGNGGTKAAGINLFSYNGVFKRDQLISPPINLSGINNALLKFDHAYALKVNPDWSDSLVVKISADCGNSWTPILQLADDGNGSFATHPFSTLNFVPNSMEDWCGSGYGSACLEADISAWANQPNVMIMFESVRLGGNNLFIDNVSVSITTDISDNESIVSQDIKVYPNPTDGQYKVQISGRDHSENFTVSVLDYTGRVVLSEKYSTSQLSNKVFDLSSYPKGLYFMEIRNKDFNAIEKIVVK